MSKEVVIRLNKYLSKAGAASRRKADEMIEQGRVKVNGKVVCELGFRLDPEHAVVELDGTRLSLPDNYVYILLNKPRGYITSLEDPEGRPVVTDLIPPNMPRIWPVGRLDWDSEGFLLLTNDGHLTHKMTHPSFHIQKRYAVKVSGDIKDDSAELKKLQTGIELEDGMTLPAQVAIRAYTDKNTWLEFAIEEGRNRQIRRMCEAVGLEVIRLRRLSMGNISIEGVEQGAFRPLLPSEVVDLYSFFGDIVPEAAKPTKRQLQREEQRRQHGGKLDVRKIDPDKIARKTGKKPKRAQRPDPKGEKRFSSDKRFDKNNDRRNDDRGAQTGGKPKFAGKPGAAKSTGRRDGKPTFKSSGEAGRQPGEKPFGKPGKFDKPFKPGKSGGKPVGRPASKPEGKPFVDRQKPASDKEKRFVDREKRFASADKRSGEQRQERPSGGKPDKPFRQGQKPAGKPFKPGERPEGKPFRTDGKPRQASGKPSGKPGKPFRPGQKPAGKPFKPGERPEGKSFKPGGKPGHASGKPSGKPKSGKSTGHRKGKGPKK